MLRTHRYLSYVATSILAVSAACSSSDRFTEEFGKSSLVSVKVPSNDLKQINFSNYIEGVELIPLESPDGALVGDVYNLSYRAGKFYLFDRREQELFVFEDDGGFLFKLNRRGQGPGEYLEMRDVKVDDNGSIYVLSYQRIHVYDSVGNDVRAIALSGLQENGVNPVGMALAVDKGFYLYVGAFALKEPQDDRYAVYQVNQDGYFEGRVWFPVTNNSTEFPRFTKVQERSEYLYTPMLGNDTLYGFSRDSIYAKYFLDYGSRKMPKRLYDGFGLGRERHEFANHNNVVTLTLGAFETSEILFYQFEGLKGNLWFSFYSKATAESFCFPYYGESGVKEAFPILRTGIGNNLYGHISPYLLRLSIGSGKFAQCFGHLENYNTLIERISSFENTDNPVVLEIRLRKF